MPKITQIKLRLSNAYLAQGEKVILGDSGLLPVLANQPLVTFSVDGRSGI